MLLAYCEWSTLGPMGVYLPFSHAINPSAQYLIVPRTWVYLALCFVISRLYANTFLSAYVSQLPPPPSFFP
ncbi:hypothetical protein L218DRAFT_967236 [Marasmius fiardii PR-910]|nr:hypothetical protein L218DRAFT_967236 [Marasmius fiardii PR-910]